MSELVEQIAQHGRVHAAVGVHHVDAVRGVVADLAYVQAADGAQLLADQRARLVLMAEAVDGINAVVSKLMHNGTLPLAVDVLDR